MKKRVLITIAAAILFLTGKGQSFSSGPLNKPIPNNTNSLYLPLTVNGLPSSTSNSFGLESLCLDITHSADFNVEVNLITPGGIRIPISLGNGGKGQNYTGTCFKMSASTSVMNGTAPFTGEFRPHGDLGAANTGSNPNGTWALIVTDNMRNDLDSGVVKSWSITFSSTPAPALSLSSSLPVIVIRTNGQYINDLSKSIVSVDIIDNSPGRQNNLGDTPGYQGKLGIKFHGSSSLNYPKKSFNIETLNSAGKPLDTTILGFHREHSWVLYSPYVDKTLIHDYLTYRIFGEMGNYSPKTRFVELVIDDQYQGVYSIEEAIKRNKHRVNIAKFSHSDITGGYLFTLNKRKGGAGWWSRYPSNAAGDSACFFQFDYPTADSLYTNEKNYLESYVDSFETALKGPDFGNPDKGYRKYIEENSFIDNFIINELGRNVDGYRLSTYFYKDKSSGKDGGKVKNGPAWDFDIAWGNANFDNGNNPQGWQYEQDYLQYYVPFWWKRFMQDTTFVDHLYCRYQKFRKTILNETVLDRIIDSTATALNEPQKRNFHQWPIIGTYVWPNPTPIPTSYQGEIDNMKKWISQRLAWMDGHINGKCLLTTDIAENSQKNGLTVYPNPSEDEFRLSGQLPGHNDMQLDIYNSAGVRVQHMDLGRQTEALDTRIDIKSFPEGIYMLKLNAGNQVYTRKLIKISQGSAYSR